MTLTLEQASSRVSYDPESGKFTRLVSARGKRKGTEAGTLNAGGYLALGIGEFDVYAHRLAFLFMTGEIPEVVDHINGNRSDNRWCNLRASSKRLNAQNMKGPMKHNRLRLLGVTKSRQNERFEARIKADGRRIFLGEFDTPEQAHQAYLDAKRILHEANTL